MPGPPAKARLARRGVVLGGLVLLAAGAGAGWQWYNPGARIGPGRLSAPEALAQVRSGQIALIDIRRPDEWARTGVPSGAVPIDMRRADFMQALADALGGDRDRPVALICARGVRSRRMVARLADAGYTQVLDVPEGVSGSGAGPGWQARGLPVVHR